MIRGAIFDVDGTLLDSMPIWEEAGERYLTSREIVPERGLGQRLYPMTMEEGACYLKHTYGLPESTGDIINGINRQIEQFYRYSARLKPGAAEFLEGLRKKGVRLTAATSSDRHLIEAAFTRLGIGPYYERIFTCTEVGEGKDKPKIFREAAACMGTAPEETLVFEDALHAIDTSLGSGFKTVGVYDASSEDRQEEIRAKVHIYMSEYRAFDLFWESASRC